MLAKLFTIQTDDALLKRRGHMLMGMLLILFFMNCIYSTAVFFTSDKLSEKVLLLFVQAIYLLSFALARSGRIDFAGTLTAFMITFICAIAPVVATQGGRVPLLVFVIPLLITGIAVRPRYTLLLCGSQVAVLLMIGLFVPQNNPIDQTPTSFLILLMMVLLGHAATSFTNRRLNDEFMASLVKAEQEEKRLRQMAEEANEAKSRFLATMSHELRTPLNAIIGYSEMFIEDLEDGLSLEEDAIDDMLRVRNSGQHLLSLVSSILDLAKVEAGKMSVCAETFSLNELILDVVRMLTPLAKEQSNALIPQLPPQEVLIMSDRTMLQQILLNLLSNANKFTQNGEIKVQLDQHDEVLVMEVCDTGIGMSPEQLKKVFEEFTQADTSTTREYGGTGLGLTLVEKFVTLLHGELNVASVLDEGTTFTITLPQSYIKTKDHWRQVQLAG